MALPHPQLFVIEDPGVGWVRPCLAFTAEKGWHASLVDSDLLAECDAEGEIGPAVAKLLREGDPEALNALWRVIQGYTPG